MKSSSHTWSEGTESPVVRRTSRGPLVASHASMRSVLAVIDRVARSSCTVLVTGDSGTGKELAVAALHDASARADGPLVTVNCGAIAPNLVESELFGHARGAFTGAMRARDGVVAAARGGTLFLDEVGELPLATQVKLLRVLQQREYTPVGESRAVAADVRIVAATNRDLAREVAAGRFREDLYYRLNVIHVRIPSLRERRDDTVLLAEHFLRAAAERAGRPDVVRFSAEALAQIAQGEWPGNVRELENAVERAVLLSPGPSIPASDALGGPTPAADLSEGYATFDEEVGPPSTLSLVVPASTSGHREPGDRGERDEVDAQSGAGAWLEEALGDEPIDLRARVAAFEDALIREALVRTGHNKAKAARLLGLHRTTLVEMVKRKGIDASTSSASSDSSDAHDSRDSQGEFARRAA